MDPIHILAVTLGTGAAAGLRLYATVPGSGLALRFAWLAPPPAMEGLRILAHRAVLAAAALAYTAEFVGGKIPWFDSLWDAVHTFIWPIGAAALAAAAFAGLDPLARAVLVILCGGAALSAHASKAALRLAVNHSPEPFSNWLLSLAGDFAVPALLWLTAAYPLAVLAAVTLFLIAFFWLARRIFRRPGRGLGALRARRAGA